VNPHPQFVEIPSDYVFITPLSGNPEAISTRSDVTSGLQELLVIFSGVIRKARDRSGIDFEPLLWSGPRSGTNQWSDFFPNGMQGPMTDSRRMRRGTDVTGDQVIAAHLKGEKDGSKVNVIFVADTDFISDQLFTIAQTEMHGLRLDNVKFILNCVDTLAGNTSYVDLRKRRPKHRALTEIQSQLDDLRAEVQKERTAAEKEAQDEIDRIQAELDKEVEAIDKDTSLSRIEKLQAKLIAQDRKQREFDVRKAKIEQAKAQKLEQLEARSKRTEQQKETDFWLRAVFLPPLPAVLLGIVVLLMRLTSEKHNVEQSRRRAG